MRLLIDTNILISAALFHDSVPAKAFTKAVSSPHETVVCDYSLDEMQEFATAWLWAYNNERPHMGIGGIPPIQKRMMAA